MDKKPFENYDLLSENPSGFDYDRFEKEEQTARTVKKKKKADKTPEDSHESERVPSEIYEWMQSRGSALLVCGLVFSFLVR
ncbi:MAG: hypothetical protein VB064_09310, partial [Oscillospiraceae bacterium]|nr:hypothetical protein [Oscillospiraceae bacterium]